MNIKYIYTAVGDDELLEKGFTSFKKWLREEGWKYSITKPNKKPFNETHIENHCKCVIKINQILRQECIIDKPVCKLSVNDLETAYNALFKNKELLIKHKLQNKQYERRFVRYIIFKDKVGK